MSRSMAVKDMETFNLGIKTLWTWSSSNLFNNGRIFTFLHQGIIDACVLVLNKNIEKQIFKNYWKLIYQVWHRYCINQEHGTISVSRLIDDLLPPFKGPMTHIFIFMKELDRFLPNFIWTVQWLRGFHFSQMFLVWWLRWPPCPCVVIPFEELVLWNQVTKNCETWYKAKWMSGYSDFFKWGLPSGMNIHLQTVSLQTSGLVQPHFVFWSFFPGGLFILEILLEMFYCRNTETDSLLLFISHWHRRYEIFCICVLLSMQLCVLRWAI